MISACELPPDPSTQQSESLEIPVGEYWSKAARRYIETAIEYADKKVDWFLDRERKRMKGEMGDEDEDD
jgi:hypothetical protein